jgi:hypothetical protein
MRNKLILKRFYSFLKENNIYDVFLYNCYLFGDNKDIIENMVYFITIGIKQYNGIYLIGDAFDWSETSEGLQFWNEINKKWRKVCETL